MGYHDAVPRTRGSDYAVQLHSFRVNRVAICLDVISQPVGQPAIANVRNFVHDMDTGA